MTSSQTDLGAVDPTFEDLLDAVQEGRAFYKKEAGLASSIADRPPRTRPAQDRRSRNRFQEHSRDGCKLTPSGVTSFSFPNHDLYRCTCSWIGWLIPKENA